MIFEKLKLMTGFSSKTREHEDQAGADRHPRQWEVAPEGEILDGRDGLALEARLATFRFGELAAGAAGTDRAMGKDPNEDAVVLVPRASMVAVIDGVGGYWGGHQAATFLGMGLLHFPDAPQKAIAHAKEQMQELDFEEGLKLYGSSACFISARLIQENHRRFLAVAQTGDCRLVILRRTGDILESEDESFVNEMVRKNLVSPDEALFHRARNRITNAVRLAFDNTLTVNPRLMLNGKRDAVETPVELFTGDRVLLMSDGISDNLTPQEIARIIQGSPPLQAVKKLASVTIQRMENMNQIVEAMMKQYVANSEGISQEHILDRVMEKIKDPDSSYHWMYHTIFQKAREQEGRFPDGFLARPSQDNRSLAIMDIL